MGKQMASAVLAPGLGSAQRSTAPLAVELGRLACAAHFFSSLCRGGGHLDEDNLHTLLKAREKLGGLVEMLRADSDGPVAIPPTFGTDVKELRELIFDVESILSTAELERELGQAKTITSDLLAGMIDFFTNTGRRVDDAAEKLFAIAKLFAEREAFEGDGVEQVRSALTRRGAFAPTKAHAAPAECLSELKELRTRIEESESAETPSAEIMDEVRERRPELSDAVFTLDGLAEMLVLEMAVQRLEDRLERQRVRGFDTLITDLRDLVPEDVDPEIELVSDEEPQPEAGEDEAALDLLAEAELDVQRSAVDASFEAEALHLDEAEAAAALEIGSESIIVRAAACRTASDRLARRHAKAHQPEGREPEAVFKPTALTLVRRAVLLERELDDSVQRFLVRGEVDTAKIVTRCLHRLSRTRLGLALLADVGPNGFVDRSRDWEADGGRDERQAEEASLRARLDKALLVRDALVEDKTAPEVKSAKLYAKLPETKVSRPILTVLAASVLAGVLFHGYHFFATPVAQAENFDDISSSVKLNSVQPVGTTFVATTKADWGSISNEEREKHMNSLWDEVEKRGFARLLMVHSDTGLPVGYVTHFELKVFGMTMMPEGGGPPTPPSELPE